MDFIETLRRTDFAGGIPSQVLPSLLALAQSRAFPPGAIIFAEGHHNSEFHIVLDGHVRLDMSIPIRGRVPLLTVGPGDVLAWSALLTRGRMTTSAVAMENVRTASFDGTQLQQLCELQPELGYHVMKQLAGALSQRLLATRLQLLDLFAEHEPIPETMTSERTVVDPEC